MEERFENIIVGAGIAGLICGGYLSKHGQRTLILEKEKEIGGRFKVYKFDGYTGTCHALTWYSTWDGGFWPSAARELGANIIFSIVKEPKLYIRGSHKPATILARCFTAPAMADYVESQFPEPLPSSLKEEFQKIFQEILSIPYKQLCDEMDTVALKDWVGARSSNPVVHAFFTSLGANLALMEARKAWEILSAGKIFALTRMYLAGDGVLTLPYPDPVEGIIKPFAEVFRSFGGQVWTEHEVAEVIIEGNRAVGVIAKEHGGKEKRLSSDRIIVNALYKDIPKLFKRLPQEMEEPVTKLEQSWLVDYWTFTGLREKVTSDPSMIMVQDPKTGSNLGLIWPISLEMPLVAPPGKQLFLYEKIYNREELKEIKKEDIYAEMDDIAEEIYPGFKKAIEVQRHASHQPLWHHQFTAFPKIPQKSLTIKGLYFVGDSTTPQYGVASDGASSTGILCAKSILGN